MLRIAKPSEPMFDGHDRTAERRASLRALVDWQDVRRQPTVPPVSAIISLGGFTRTGNRLLLKQDPNPMRSVFILGNEELQATLGRRLGGAIVDDILPDSLRTRIGLACAAAVTRNEARAISGSYEGAGGIEVRYRGIFMPVSAADGRHTGYIFGAYSSRSYSRDDNRSL